MLKRAAALVALAAVAAPAAAQAETLTIQVTSVVVKVTAIDKKPRGTSAGDRVIQRNKLLNARRQFGKAKGTHVGTDEGTVTFTSAHSERYEGVTRLPGGTLKVKGVVRPLVDGGIGIPVVGGTGRFRDAKGMLYVGKGENRALNVYRITLPGHVA